MPGNLPCLCCINFLAAHNGLLIRQLNTRILSLGINNLWVPEIALHPVRSFDQRSHEGSGLVFEVGFGNGQGTGMHFGLQIAI